MKNRVDSGILVSGAGIVGLSAALALARLNLPVSLIEEKSLSLPIPQKDYALRVSAITPASTAFLQHLGVWQTLPMERLAPFHAMSILDNSHGGEVLHFSSEGLPYHQLGYIVENVVLQQALWQALQKQPNVSIHMPARITHWENSPDKIQVFLQDGAELEGKLLIGADGADSTIRHLANIGIHRKLYGEQSIVATIQTELPHGDTARQHFLPTGPVALLPLADPYHCSLVWSTSTTEAEQLQALSTTDFSTALQNIWRQTLGQLNIVSERLSFPLRLQYAHSYIDDRLALVGDAAHVIHPMAGQGVNLGLQDVRLLVKSVLLTQQQKRDIGTRRMLRRYERAAKSGSQMMLTLVDTLHTTFQFSHPLLSLLRHTGVSVVNRCSLLKQWMTLYAMGLTEDE